MACYHPLKAFILGIKDNGKKDLRIYPYDTECIYQPYPGANWEPHGYVLDRNFFAGRIVTDFIPIPCGQCIGCRLEHSRQWAIRCMLESENYAENYFITFTYDESHVPYNEYVDHDGVIQQSMTLVKSDMQKFIKRVRSDFDYRGLPNFRYFYCGEYGTTSARPHYHMIAFGLHLDDLKFYKKTDVGNLYTSEYLTEKWKNGIVVVGDVTFESCSYVSRYIVKKQKGKNSGVYDYYNITPEYIDMSRNPGIGKEYILNNYDVVYPRDSIVVRGGLLVRPPRFFDTVMSSIDEDLMSEVKQKRRDIAEEIQKLKDDFITADYQTSLEYAERNQLARASKLIRPL